MYLGTFAIAIEEIGSYFHQNIIISFCRSHGLNLHIWPYNMCSLVCYYPARNPRGYKTTNVDNAGQCGGICVLCRMQNICSMSIPQKLYIHVQYNLRNPTPAHSDFLSNPAKHLSLMDFPIDYNVKIPFIPYTVHSEFRPILPVYMTQFVLCIPVAKNHRIIIVHRLFDLIAPNFVSGNNSIET